MRPISRLIKNWTICCSLCALKGCRQP